MTTLPRTPTTAAGRKHLQWLLAGDDVFPEDALAAILAIEAEARAAPDPAPLDVERLAVVAAARALRERLTIDPGNVVSWGEWDTLDEALASIEGSKP